MALIAEAANDRLADADAGAVKSVTILGSTGSVGCSTLDLIGRDRSRFNLVALTAHRNVATLIAQAKEYRPHLAVVADPACFAELKEGLKGTGIEVAAGPEAVVDAAARPADWVMAGIVGAAGLAPTLAAVKRGACVALANKECLVSAGPLFLDEVRRSGATLLPVDSEHNAIFQVLDAGRLDTVESIVLTASGGPFRTWSLQEMAKATPAQAVAHPRWDMGAKISVDSATLMNKGLELIEAHYLFPVGQDRLDVIIHPESIVHSMVAYIDGSVLAQLGMPDMRTPIAYALAWPRRMAAPAARLDLAQIGQLTFEAPDLKRFPALSLAREALRIGGSAPTVLNAANEVAVAAFLAGRIAFPDMVALTDAILAQSSGLGAPPAGLAEVYELDRMTRIRAEEMVQKSGR
ncbi:1-deoxy-D-xylulose-5-phosphate reductoisomerase [Parvibaculum sp.]|uniref:1-deoxy-D-xylulose-5-phosphate reductoisomerase n=1 Tax=Parvibaculum sp. TaxID=2024848 RepID=UPI001D20463A|nr:1-deoxy-D-xylulose-5-phosphate reductoisomerase [Parvibaculum sp.]MBX3491194.1 1-deoxy-D-xylulose-5-phosphate reductoisomerase [Parvibaculum sp.]MCW5729014.1 1-deoxy-D-xylulose-5-phosphate reductoisomerase [Parvibaculum sp.]